VAALDRFGGLACQTMETGPNVQRAWQVLPGCPDVGLIVIGHDGRRAAVASCGPKVCVQVSLACGLRGRRRRGRESHLIVPSLRPGLARETEAEAQRIRAALAAQEHRHLERQAAQACELAYEQRGPESSRTADLQAERSAPGVDRS
jgi:hypothetical protein